jgi:geranylgeranyl diphosphate synthase type I
MSTLIQKLKMKDENVLAFHSGDAFVGSFEFNKYLGYPELKIMENLYDGMEYAISSGGKRLRPVLCLLTCKALGGNVNEVLPVAVAIEIVHNATLVHDDIEDGDEIRRGRPSVWKRYGTPHATNIGDTMIFKSYESLIGSDLPVDKKADIISKFTRVLIELTEGQSMEFNFRERGDVKIDEYVEMARKKAGILIGFSFAAGASVANATEQTQSMLYELGSDIGLAFMIRDDVLNLVGEQEKYGKEIGGDIKEGKRTLMVIDCISRCEAGERKKILGILKKGRGSVSDDEVKFVIEAMKKYGSISFAQKYSEQLVKNAREKIGKIGNDKLREMLEDFSDFMVKREK